MTTRVLLVLNDGNQGGIAKSVTPILRDPGDIIFGVVCGTDGTFAEELRSNGIGVNVIDFTRSQLDVGVLLKLRRTIRANRAQIVHAHHPRAYLRTRLAAKMESVPHISTPHVALLDEIEAGHVGWWRRRYMLFREQITSGMDTVTVALSSANRGRLIQQGIRMERIRIIPNGIDLEKFRPGGCTELRKSLGWKGEDFVIGAIGRLSPEKSLTDLLKAVAKLPSQSSLGGTTCLLLVGDGPERKNLENAAHSLGIHERTIFAGFQEEVKEYLGVMDVVAFTSLRETLPFALLEAMAMEKPVVAVDIPPFISILQKGGGLLVKRECLHEGISQLINDPNQARALSRQARRIVTEEYDQSRAISAMKQLYCDVATGRTGSARNPA